MATEPQMPPMDPLHKRIAIGALILALLFVIYSIVINALPHDEDGDSPAPANVPWQQPDK